MDPEKLLLRISLGKPLVKSELAEVIQFLEAADSTAIEKASLVDDIYACIRVIGKANLLNYSYLLEKFLDGKDPQTVSLVLETLCVDWGKAEEFLERLYDFTLGSSWDLDEDVRQTAIKALGEYLKKKREEGSNQTISFASSKKVVDFKRSPREKEEDQNASARREGKVLHVLELLLSVFDDTECDEITRHAAYCALLRASGKDWEDLPSECVLLDFRDGSNDINWEVVANLRKSVQHIEPNGKVVDHRGKSDRLQ